LRPEAGFLPDVEELDGLVTERTSALLVNFPSNPLGSVLPAGLAEALCRFADRHDLWVISDECYDEILFGAEQVSPARWDDQERVISCFSFSKTYAMTGMRVGYLVAPEALAATAAKLQEPMIACINAPAQRAALAALEGPQDFVALMRRTYHERRDAAGAQLDHAGVG
jgi:aspartate aminotransferase